MKRVLTSLCISIALLFAGCVDREFDLAETSSEITIGGEELVVPLGEISKVTIEDIFGDSGALRKGEDGLYGISVSSFANDPEKYESISIGGFSIPNINCGLSTSYSVTFGSIKELPNELTIQSIERSLPVDIPTIINAMEIKPIETHKELSINLPSYLPNQGSINSTILSQLQSMNSATIKSSEEYEVVFDADITILEELKEIKWVEFGCDEHPYGAPFEAKLSLNGLSDINGGGNLKFKIEFPDGYHLNDKDGKELSTHNIFESNYHVDPKQKEVSFLLYLSKIDYRGEQFTNGKLKINDHIRYSYDITMDVGTGDYDLSNAPIFSLSSAPKYKDIEIALGNFETTNNEDVLQYNMKLELDGLPNEIKVSKVAFNEAPLNISLKGLEWLKVRCYDTGETFSPSIEVVIPECIRFKEHELLNSSTNSLIATAAELSNGITLHIDHIDCEANGVSQNNGKLSIDDNFLASIHLEKLSNHTIHLSDITPPADFAGYITLSITETNIKLDAQNSVVSSTNEIPFSFDIEDNIPKISEEIEIPEMVTSIKSISIGKANSNDPVQMKFSLGKASSFPVDELVVNASVNLGNLLKPTIDMLVENGGSISKDRNGNYILLINESWKPKENSLVKIVTFDALDNIPAIVNGKIAVNQSFPITGSVKIKDGASVDISAISGAKVDINLSLDDIKISAFQGCLNVSGNPDPVTAPVPSLADLNITINSLNINPVLKINIKDNPIGAALYADILIKSIDASNNVMNEVEIPAIAINERGASNIVISTPYNEDKYKGEDVTFISAQALSKLLSKGIPSEIIVDLEVYSDKDKVVTIDLNNTENGYKIEYQYEVAVPLEFDENVNISCETNLISGVNSSSNKLNEILRNIADSTEGLKVGDIGLIVEVGTTIPFNLILSAELLNAEGTTENMEVKLDAQDCLIKGHTGKNGEEKTVSKTNINFDLGNSHTFEGLRDVYDVRFKFTLYSTGDNAALKSDQYIDGTLKLRVRDGLTLDIFDFLKNKKE